jgi:hypothetical protein
MNSLLGNVLCLCITSFENIFPLKILIGQLIFSRSSCGVNKSKGRRSDIEDVDFIYENVKITEKEYVPVLAFWMVMVESTALNTSQKDVTSNEYIDANPMSDF